jgi:hypothetical protein
MLRRKLAFNNAGFCHARFPQISPSIIVGYEFSRTRVFVQSSEEAAYLPGICPVIRRDIKGRPFGVDFACFDQPTTGSLGRVGSDTWEPSSRKSSVNAGRLLVTYRDRDVAFVWTLEHLFKTNRQRSSSVQIKPPQPKNSFLSAISTSPATIRIDNFEFQSYQAVLECIGLFRVTPESFPAIMPFLVICG